MEEEASISIGPLKIWISGRQFPNHQDYWDGNWLNTIAVCEGAFLHLSELKKWREDLQEFQRTLKGSIELQRMEPELKIKIEEKKTSDGHLKCEVEITGNHMAERHRYILDIDQSYLPGLLSQLAAVLREFPIRDEKQQVLKVNPK